MGQSARNDPTLAKKCPEQKNVCILKKRTFLYAIDFGKHENHSESSFCQHPGCQK